MKLDKIKSLAFLFTIVFSSITYSQTQDLYTSACDAFNYNTAIPLSYTDVDLNSFLSTGDTADTASNLSFNDGEYYINDGIDVFKVTLTTNGPNYDITRGTIIQECAAGAGSTQVDLYTSACDAFNNNTAIPLSYTDVDLNSFLSTGDTADTASNLSFNDGEYYINDGIDVFKVTLTTNGPNYDITRGTIIQECAAGAGSTQVDLYTSACDAFNNNTAIPLSYTDVDLNSFLSTGDTADTASNLSFNDGEYYINDGIDVFKVTLTTNGPNYDITRGTIIQECAAGAGSTQVDLYTSACDAFNNNTAIPLSYTDVDLNSFLSTGDTADTASNLSFNDGEYYINDGIDVFKVTLTTNGPNYDITRGTIIQECAAGAGSTQVDLYTSACDAFNYNTAIPLSYTDVDLNSFLSTGDTADTASNLSFNDGEYYINDGIDVFKVTLTTNGPNYDITRGTIIQECAAGAGSTQVDLYTSACDAFNYNTAISLSYTDVDLNNFLSTGDTADTASNLSFNDGEYYINDGIDVFKVTLTTNGPNYDITRGTIIQECAAGAGSTQVDLYTSACDAFNYNTAIPLSYTDVDLNSFLSTGDTADTASNLSFNDGEYYINDGIDVFKVTLTTNGPNYDITRGTIIQECAAGAGSTQVDLYTSACDAFNYNTAISLSYTDVDLNNFLSTGDTADTASNLSFNDGEYYINDGIDVFKVTLTTNGPNYDITRGTIIQECAAGAGSTQVDLYTSACDAFNYNTAIPLSYTDVDLNSFLSTGDTADTASNLSFNDGEYYINDGIDVFKVTLTTNGPNYDITRGTIIQECAAGAGSTQVDLYTSACDAFNYNTAISLSYTDVDLNNFLSTGDTADTASNLSFNDGEYYINDGIDVFKVTLTTNGPNYDITRGTIIQECAAGAGSTQVDLYTSACDAFNYNTAIPLSYTDVDLNSFLSTGDTADTASNLSFNDGEYYINDGIDVFKVTLTTNGPNYDITRGTIIQECAAGAGSTQVDLYTSACDAFNYNTAISLSYTDVDLNNFLSTGDTADTASNLSFNDGEYYINDGIDVFKVTLTTNGPNYDITRGTIIQECAAGAGSTQVDLYTSACDAFNYNTAIPLSYTDVDLNSFLSTGDTADTASNLSFNDGEYYINDGIDVFKVTLTTNGPNYDITRGTIIQECAAGAGSTQVDLYTSACDAFNYNTAISLSYTDVDLNNFLSTGDTADTASNLSFNDGEYYINDGIDVFKVTLTTNGPNYDITREITPVECDNTAPVITSGITGTDLAENSGAEQTIYTIVANDAVGVTGYTIGGTDASLLTLTDDVVSLIADPDYETKSSYSFTVTASDAIPNISDVTTVTFSITDVDDTAPVITSGITGTDLAENSGAEQTIYTIVANDAVGVTGYTIGGTDASLLTLTDDVVSLIADPDYETKSSYSFTVTASDAIPNISDVTTVTFSITDVDDTAPVITSGITGTDLVENSGAEQTIYTIVANDAVGVTGYTIGGTDASLLTLTDDVVSLIADPDYETKSSYSFTVTASDAIPNISDVTTVTFSITDVDDTAPVITSGITGTDLVENSGAEQTIYTIVANDAVGVTGYTIGGTDASLLTLTDDVVSLIADPDYETKSSYSFTVTASDAIPNTSDVTTVTFSITDVDDTAPVITSGITGTDLVENSGAEQTIYTIVANDAVGVTGYTIGGTDASLLTLTDDVVSLIADPDYETKSSYSFTVTASDAIPNTSDVTTVTFSITDVDDTAPVITSGITGTDLVENSGAEQTIYTIVANDAVGVTGYTIGGTDASLLTLTDDVVSLIANPDYETKSSYSFTVTASDAIPNTSDVTTVTFSITDVDDTAPVITSGITGTDLAENSGAEQTIYTIVANDAVGVTGYTIGGTDASLLTLTDDVVSLIANPDYETKSSYSFTVTASDAIPNTSDVTTVTFSITDVDDTAPVITLTGEATVTIEVGTTYTDAVATATDNYDGDLTSSIVTVNPVDETTVRNLHSNL